MFCTLWRLGRTAALACRSKVEQRFDLVCGIRQPFCYLSARRYIDSVSCCIQVYISCSVLMCEAGNPNTRCSQGCVNSGSGDDHHHHRKREAVTQSLRHLVSQGPLRLRRSAESTGSPGMRTGSVFWTPASFESRWDFRKFKLCFSFLQWWTWIWTWLSSLDVFWQLLAWSAQWSCTKPKCQGSNTNLCPHLKAKAVVCVEYQFCTNYILIYKGIWVVFAMRY